MRVFRSLLPPLLVWIIAGCSSSSAPGNNNAPPPTPTSNDIGIGIGAETRTTTAFNPNPKNVALGGGASATIRWINQDISGGDYTMGTAVAHQITSSDNPAAFAMGPLLGGNATYSITLSAPGTYNYHCNIHPNMVGTITVTP